MLCREIIAVCSKIRTKLINTLCGQNGEVLGAFAKLRKATISFVMFVRLYVRMEEPAAPVGRIFKKFYILGFVETLSRKNSSSMKFQQDLQALHMNVEIYLTTVTRTPLNVTLIRT